MPPCVDQAAIRAVRRLPLPPRGRLPRPRRRMAQAFSVDARSTQNARTPTSLSSPLPSPSPRAAPAAAAAPRRPFFSLAAAALGPSGAGAQQHSLTTVRTLPYAAGDLFRIIADVDAYAQFLPHCTTSRVTHWRRAGKVEAGGRLGGVGNADRLGKADASAAPAWPARADLTVGWGPISQTYSSRVYCVPGAGVVEAVSGRGGAPTLTAAERAEIGLAVDEDADGRRLGAQTASDDDTFESLVTRWQVTPLGPSDSATPSPSTRVELRIRFQFRNPLYQMAAAQVGNEMATRMIEAFETRAAALLRWSSKTPQL